MIQKIFISLKIFIKNKNNKLKNEYKFKFIKSKRIKN